MIGFFVRPLIKNFKERINDGIYVFWWCPKTQSSWNIMKEVLGSYLPIKSLVIYLGNTEEDFVLKEGFYLKNILLRPTKCV